jgi:hypothetical protein
MVGTERPFIKDQSSKNQDRSIIISRPRTASPVERKVRAYLSRGKGQVGPLAASTLVRLSDWVESIQSDTPATARSSGLPEHGPTAEFIERTATRLTKTATGMERNLLSKSLQESLFYCVGFDEEIDFTEFRARIVRHENRRGAPSILQLFLSLYFFNCLWFDIGDSFRALAGTPDSFERDMEGVEALCQKAVTTVWRPIETSKQPLELMAARQIVRDIEQHLRGAQISETR